MPSLFGLAPGGVYRAVSVTGDAVRSYRTLSPLPATGNRSRPAVCFLWHFPWGRPRRALPGTVFPWSPDFPPPLPQEPADGGGHPAVWLFDGRNSGAVCKRPLRRSAVSRPQAPCSSSLQRRPALPFIATKPRPSATQRSRPSPFVLVPHRPCGGPAAQSGLPRLHPGVLPAVIRQRSLLPQHSPSTSQAAVQDEGGAGAGLRR